MIMIMKDYEKVSACTCGFTSHKVFAVALFLVAKAATKNLNFMMFLFVICSWIQLT